MLDAADKQKCEEFGITLLELSSPNWEMEMYSGSIPPSQRVADKMIEKGFSGMRYRSFAAGAGSDEFNLVLWKWGPERPVKVQLVDDEGRLGSSYRS